MTASVRPRFQHLYPTLLIAWVLAMIALPIVRWSVGDDALRWGVAATVILQTSAVLVILTGAWGIARTARVALTVALWAWALEAVGVATGIPFGAYHYTDRLQPQIANVPLLIPAAWLMMLPPAWAVAHAVVGERHRAAGVVVSALAFTAWDLFLDPQMAAWGFWQWEQAGGYFGIPWSNFVGWMFGAVGATLLARPSQLPQRPLIIIYGITWALETIGQLFFWGLPGPAIVGCCGMGIFIAWMAIMQCRDRS